MKLKKEQKIEIEGDKFVVGDISQHSHKEGEEEKTYYIYSLTSEDSNITHAEIDDYNSGDFVFHITKKVKSKVSKGNISIEDKSYSIAKEKDEIFIDPINGDLQEAKCYEVTGTKTGLVPSELHILPDGSEIFYLTMKLKEEDIICN